jgi:two-component system chemotaxis response regulator CheY
MFDPKTKILVVDDMLTMRKIVSKNLKDFGFTDIVEAPDGSQAWKLLEAGNSGVQLVISDWNMPNCSGLELLKKVRGDSRFHTLPFVMLTAEAEAHQVKEAIAARVTGYIIKPFTGDALKQKLEQASTVKAAA